MACRLNLHAGKIQVHSFKVLHLLSMKSFETYFFLGNGSFGRSFVGAALVGTI